MINPILVNLVPPTAGGGLQNAVSLSLGIADSPDFRDRAIIVCPRGGPVHKSCEQHGLTVVPIRSGIIGRIGFELGIGSAIARRHSVSTVFTLFGNAPLVSPGLYRISGFVLSNILMPEIDFWQDIPPLRRKIKKLKDHFRLWAARLSQEIIVETDFLAERARTGPFQDKIVHVVKMEPSATVVSALAQGVPSVGTDQLRLLALTGPHPNKRLIKMAPIMAKLAALRAEQGAKPPEFLISFGSQHPHAKVISSAFEAAGAPPPKFLGMVAPTAVGDLLKKVDGLVNIARLESFSNNWVEAWAAGVAMVSTDADWARASCADAAIYIDPENPDEGANRLDAAFADPEAIQALATAGYQQLSDLSEQGSKVDAYHRILVNATKLRTDLT